MEGGHVACLIWPVSIPLSAFHLEVMKVVRWLGIGRELLEPFEQLGDVPLGHFLASAVAKAHMPAVPLAE